MSPSGKFSNFWNWYIELSSTCAPPRYRGWRKWRKCIGMLLYTLTTHVIKICLYCFHTKRNNFICYVHSFCGTYTGQYLEGFTSAHMCKVLSHYDPNSFPLCTTKLHLKTFSPSTSELSIFSSTLTVCAFDSKEMNSKWSIYVRFEVYGSDYEESCLLSPVVW